MDDRGCYTYDKDGVHASTNTVNPTANGKKQTFIPIRRNYIDMAHAMKVQKL